MLPIPANTTCDLYRTGNAPPADPDIAGLQVYLKPDWVAGNEHGDRHNVNLMWTHILFMDFSVDVRDNYSGGSSANSTGDTLYVPDQNGTPFKVNKIEVRGGCKVLYIDRQTPSWPTANL